MDTTVDPKQTDPHHVLAAHADEQLAHAHEQITRADEEIARANKQLSRIEHEAARRRSRGNRRSLGGRAARAFTGLMLTACICVAAIIWQSTYGDAVRQIVVRWAPQLVATSSLALQNPGVPAQHSPCGSGSRDGDSPYTRTPLAQTASVNVAPIAATMSPESTQLLRSMAQISQPWQGFEPLEGEPSTNGPRLRQCRGAARRARNIGPLIAKASERTCFRETPPPPNPTAASDCASRCRRSGRRKPQHDRSANLFRSCQLRGISLVRLALASMAP